ncbi:MAG: GPW/gp25 family protein [bacterium]
MKGIAIYDTDFFSVKSDRDLVIESIKRILLTSPGEHVGNLSFGSYIKDYLFNFENIIIEDIEQEITRALNRWEPRIILNNIEAIVAETAHKISVKIEATISETYENISLTTELVF